MQQGTSGLIELILSSEDFNDFVAVIEYLDIIQSSSSDALTKLAATQKELDSTRDALAQQLTDAEAEAQAASAALDQAVAARTALEDQIAAQAAAEAAERQAAIQAAADAAAASASSSSFTTESGTAPRSRHLPMVRPPRSTGRATRTPSSQAGGHASMTTLPARHSQDTVPPLPRRHGTMALTPASRLPSRSSRAAGTLLLLPVQRLGDGEAPAGALGPRRIWAPHRRPRQRYGGHLTYAAAKKYCPPNADFWYSTVLAEMERI